MVRCLSFAFGGVPIVHDMHGHKSGTASSKLKKGLARCYLLYLSCFLCTSYGRAMISARLGISEGGEGLSRSGCYLSHSSLLLWHKL